MAVAGLFAIIYLVVMLLWGVLWVAFHLLKLPYVIVRAIVRRRRRRRGAPPKQRVQTWPPPNVWNDGTSF